MTTTGDNNALRRLAELMGDETRVDDGAENWMLWCLIDANQDGLPDPVDDVVYQSIPPGSTRWARMGISNIRQCSGPP